VLREIVRPVDFVAPPGRSRHLPHVSPEDIARATLRYRPTVLAWARSYVRPHEAEDVAQGVLEALARNGARVDAAAIEGWLRSATFRVAKNIQRQHARRKDQPITPEMPDLATAPEDGPEETLVSSQRRRTIWEAIRALVPQRRRVLVEVEIHGREIADVAREDGIPESTAASRLVAAKADMRADLGRQRAEERRRTGGFSSWLVAWGLLDLRVWARRGLAALGAATAGGALCISATSGETLASTPEERPAMAFEVPSVSQPVTSWAERSQERVTAEVTRPRERHDAGRRFRAERFGAE